MYSIVNFIILFKVYKLMYVITSSKPFNYAIFMFTNSSFKIVRNTGIYSLVIVTR